ncbi:unnamed protein product [Phytophthora fragariaefolia]|uniref:Unnamed protein product n=1 Tax=Phytophthora fragariaefolia TaxID=1490495 RepID=A0A9W7DB26_9STRA|nr:unnamed protein product [Phytophthora fragariaefolia]
MEVAKLRQELTQCWLAESLVQVLERTATQFKVDDLLVVSLGDAAVGDQGGVLSKLVNGFVQQSESLATRNEFSLAGGDWYAHMSDLDELQLWMSESCRGRPTGTLFVIYAPSESEAGAKQVAAVVKNTLALNKTLDGSMVLVVHDPTGLLGLKASSRAAGTSSMYYLEYLATESLHETEGDRRSKLNFIAQPLDSLRDQCGWHFVLQIVGCAPDFTGTVEKSFGAARAKIFETMNQMPFQLLLLILRWSHFHPEIVRACAKKLRRQTQLIPQLRVRQELEELQLQECKLWCGLYPCADHYRKKVVMGLTQDQASSLLFMDTTPQTQRESSKLVRLSQCRLWDTQKQFYKDQGILAWSSGAVPFGVSSSSFLASAYARIAADFLLSNADNIKPSFQENDPPNCFVWEAASGSCKFLHSFMLHFTNIVEADDEFRRRGLLPLVIATDLSEQVLLSRRQMSCFRPFIERGQLDFALFDTHEFINGDASKRGVLELVHAREKLHVGSEGPVALLGNYFLDSLRADIFTVAVQRDCQACNDSNRRGTSSGERVKIQAALLNEDTSSIADIDICLQTIEDPRIQPIYEDIRLNSTLAHVLDNIRCSFELAVEPISSSGLVLFPVEAFQFLLTLVDRKDEADVFPVAILAGDARFSFRDAISSAFITTGTTEQGSMGQLRLEVPQLSPHPECFCLPVDFEIFMVFLEHLGANMSASSEVVSAPANDTFDVFLATINPLRHKATNLRHDASPVAISNSLQLSLKHQFSRFTPGDCDLLWGMMSFDEGARCFSIDTLLVLLAQTGWDFDLFVVLKWELLNRLRQQEECPEMKDYQQLLVEAGKKSWRTFYHMEQQSETDATTRGIRLQLARWFYGNTFHSTRHNRRKSVLTWFYTLFCRIESF